MRGRHLRLVSSQPFTCVLQSVVMPDCELDVRRLDGDPSPLGPEDKALIAHRPFEPGREVTVVNYGLEPPTRYVVLCRRRYPLGAER